MLQFWLKLRKAIFMIAVKLNLKCCCLGWEQITQNTCITYLSCWSLLCVPFIMLIPNYNQALVLYKFAKFLGLRHSLQMRNTTLNVFKVLPTVNLWPFSNAILYNLQSWSIISKYYKASVLFLRAVQFSGLVFRTVENESTTLASGAICSRRQTTHLHLSSGHKIISWSWKGSWVKTTLMNCKYLKFQEKTEEVIGFLSTQEAFCGGSCLHNVFGVYEFCTADRRNNIQTVSISNVQNLSGNFTREFN
jgi:hypothetical protein